MSKLRSAVIALLILGIAFLSAPASEPTKPPELGGEFNVRISRGD